LARWSINSKFLPGSPQSFLEISWLLEMKGAQQQVPSPRSIQLTLQAQLMPWKNLLPGRAVKPEVLDTEL
jgi:hypothetical protein